jgi:hypothetical protein
VGVVGTPDELFVLLQDRGCRSESSSESLGDTSPYRKLYQQFGAVCGNRLVVLTKIKSVMVTMRRSNPVQNETQGEVQPTNRDDVRGEAESAGPEARITQLSQQLAQAQKNVEDLLAQNALLTAAQTPPPFNHEAVEGTNPDGNPEGQGEKAVPRNEDHVVPINSVPPTYSEKRLQKMVLDLGAKYDALSRTIDQKRDGKESLVDNLFQHQESIFTEEVSNFDLPGRFKVPDIPIFSGSENPVEHLDNFRSHVSLHKTPDAVACRAFALTLSGKARDWHRNLPPRSIDSFDALGRKFLAQFVSERARRKPSGYLLSVRQGPNESLKDYLWRFN